jgi:hypothetical protein
VSNSSLVRDAYPDLEESRDLEHVGEIIPRAVLQTGKLRTCAGCGGWFTGREIHEVSEDYESLTWFPGDPLCEPCALAHGVL